MFDHLDILKQSGVAKETAKRAAVEDRRLAGAIGPDDREQLAVVHVERHLVDRRDTAEAQRDVADVEQMTGRLGHDSHLLRLL